MDIWETASGLDELSFEDGEFEAAIDGDQGMFFTSFEITKPQAIQLAGALLDWAMVEDLNQSDYEDRYARATLPQTPQNAL